MPSGGVEYNFPETENFTHHEDRTVRIPIVDSAGDPMTDFTDWSFAFYLFHSLKANIEAISTGALVTKTSANGGITDPAVAPNVDILIVPTDYANMKSKIYKYELYGTDADGKQTRLAYGDWPLID